MMTSDHRFHFPLSPEPMDPETHIEAQRGVLAAIPDLHFDIEEMVGEGDLVVTRFVLHGTHRAEFQGLPASGNTITFRGMNMMRVVDGKNVEEWDALDTLTFMQQVGAIPTPG